jgi:hypothetical protein
MSTYILVIVNKSEPCITGFRGPLHDASMLESDVLQPSADQGSDEGDYSDPCPEDEALFNLGPDWGSLPFPGRHAQPSIIAVAFQ